MKFLLLFICLLFLTGCVTINNDKRDKLKYVNQCLIIAHRITYKPDLGGDYWQLPNETIDRGTGDCEDIALYFQYMLVEYGIECKFIIGCTSGLPDGKSDLHAWNEVKINNDIYIIDPTSNFIRDKDKNKWLYKWDITQDYRYVKSAEYKIRDYSYRARVQGLHKFANSVKNSFFKDEW